MSNIDAAITVVGTQPTFPRGWGARLLAAQGAGTVACFLSKHGPVRWQSHLLWKQNYSPGRTQPHPGPPAPRLLWKVPCSLGHHRLHGGSLSGGRVPPPAARVTPRVPRSPPLTALQHSAMRCCPPRFPPSPGPARYREVLTSALGGGHGGTGPGLDGAVGGQLSPAGALLL